MKDATNGPHFFHGRHLAVISVLILPFTLFGWTPGAVNADWPNVVATETEGQYRPMAGWKFANDEPGDFSVVPIVPPEDLIVGQADGHNVRIPAPADSLPISAIPAWQETFGALDAKNPLVVVPGHWIAVVETGRIVETYIQIPKGLVGRECSFSDYLTIRRETKRQSANAQRSFLKEAKDAIEKQYRNADAGYDTPDVTGIKTIEFRELDERSFAWTIARTQLENISDKVVKTITITATIGMWANQNQFSLCVSTTVVDPEKVEEMVAETQRRAHIWMENVYSTNGLTGEVPDAEGYPSLASSDDEAPCDNADSDKFDNSLGLVPRHTRASERTRVGGRNLAIGALVLFAGVLIRKKFKTSAKNLDQTASTQTAPSATIPEGAPIGVRIVIAELWLSCIVLAIGFIASPGMAKLISAAIGCALCLWVAKSINAGRNWPRIYLLVAGGLALACGILERATVPADIWTETSIELTVAGIINLIMGCLLSTDHARRWVAWKRQQPEERK